VHRARLGVGTHPRAAVRTGDPVSDTGGDPCYTFYRRPALSSGIVLPATSGAGRHSLWLPGLHAHRNLAKAWTRAHQVGSAPQSLPSVAGGCHAHVTKYY